MGPCRDDTCELVTRAAERDPRVKLVSFRGTSGIKPPRPAQIRAWLRDWVVVAAVDDSTYGTMGIYRRRRRE